MTPLVLTFRLRTSPAKSPGTSPPVKPPKRQKPEEFMPVTTLVQATSQQRSLSDCPCGPTARAGEIRNTSTIALKSEATRIRKRMVFIKLLLVDGPYRLPTGSKSHLGSLSSLVKREPGVEPLTAVKYFCDAW